MRAETAPRKITAKEARRLARLEAFRRDIYEAREAHLAEVRAGIRMEDSTIPGVKAFKRQAEEARRKSKYVPPTSAHSNSMSRSRLVELTVTRDGIVKVA